MPVSQARARIQEASSEFDWIIVDLHCAASDLTLTLPPELSDIVLVATPDLARAGAPSANIRLALNRLTPHGPLTATDVELVIQHSVEWKVPEDYRRLQASSEWGLTGDSPLALAIRDIAAGLVIGLRTPAEPSQFFWMSRCEEVLA